MSVKSKYVANIIVIILVGWLYSLISGVDIWLNIIVNMLISWFWRVENNKGANTINIINVIGVVKINNFVDIENISFDASLAT